MMRLLRLAARSLLRNKGRSAISALVILIGVSQMIYGRAGTNGVVTALIEDLVQSKIGAVQIYRTGFLDAEQDPLRFDMPDDDALIARLRAVPGVRAVSRRILFEGMLGNGHIQTVFVATAIDPQHEYQVCPRRRSQVAPGSAPLQPGGDHAADILIGQALADGLGATVGSTVFASSMTQGGSPNALDVTVAGLLPAGGAVDNKASAVVPLALAQSLLRMPGRVTEYVLDVQDLGRVEAVTAALHTALGDGYQVKSWRDRPQIRDFEQSMRAMMAVAALLLSVLVGGVIINTMLMSIYERVREIGTLLAIGVRRRQVLALFLLESLLLGLFGAMGGALLGLLLIRVTGDLRLPASELSGALIVHPQIGADSVLGTVLAAVLVTGLAGLYPAWRASRMRPIDALRAQ